MSSPSATGNKPSKLRRGAKFGLLLGFLVAGVGTYAYFNLPNYWLERMRLEMDVVWDNHIQNDSQMGKEIARGRKKDDNKKEFTMADIVNDRKAVMPSAERAAAIELVAKEWEATAQGLTLPHPPRYLPGNSTDWMATNIPIYNSCVRIWAAGRITRDPYTTAGPSGIEPALTGDPHYQRAHGDKITLLQGVPWGAFSGRVCDDESAQKNCGPAFPIGASRYLWSGHFGPGKLSVVNNTFVPRLTEFGLLSGRPIMDLGDNRANTGGYTFDQEPAPPEMCGINTSPTH